MKKEDRAEYYRKWRAEHPGYFAEKHREWRKRNRKQFQTNYTFAKHKKKNGITPLPCSVCGYEKTEAHHPDYSKPLLVVWLCKEHHEEIHHE